MSKKTKIFIWVAVIVVILVVLPYSIFKSAYNQLITLDEATNNAWANVQTQLQRRYDLIPNYVETVKGYAIHEREVLIEVTKARAQVGSARTVSEQIKANNALSGALSRLLVVVERYPELKANQNFIRLQDELSGTENRIAVARRRYNQAVREYNQKIRSFPILILARMLNFQPKPYFEAPTEAQKAPKVDFSR
ncbi:LemA family protein [candidate division KSB1 bacterium]|nr:MAG: LemA family protein [candidate division KSB1 bacterium]RKY84407.1 MAG: LemA family protein [candidate division KSB1 bacterium]